MFQQIRQRLGKFDRFLYGLLVGVPVGVTVAVADTVKILVFANLFLTSFVFLKVFNVKWSR